MLMVRWMLPVFQCFKMKNYISKTETREDGNDRAVYTVIPITKQIK